MRLRRLLSIAMYPNGKVHFLMRLREDPAVLDVGCGNNSPYQVKSILPRSTYTGVDVVGVNVRHLLYVDDACALAVSTDSDSGSSGAGDVGDAAGAVREGGD